MSTLSIQNTARSDNQPRDSTANGFHNGAEFTGRVLLAAIFLITGVGKIGAYAGTVAYMASFGVLGALLPLVIATQVLGSIAIIIGWKTRVTALLLAGFTLLAGLIFHRNLDDQIQMIMFLKNVAIAGGFLLLAANGAGALSLDRLFAMRKNSGATQ